MLTLLWMSLLPFLPRFQFLPDWPH